MLRQWGRQRRAWLPLVWITLSVLCVFIDYSLGPFIQFPIVYMVPVTLAAWNSGRISGLALAATLPLSRLYFITMWDPPWTLAESVVNAVTHGMDMKTAVSVPRFHSEEKQLLFIEPAFPESTAEALRALGNEVERSTYMSRVQAIRALPNGELEAGPDPRGGAGVGRHP